MDEASVAHLVDLSLKIAASPVSERIHGRTMKGRSFAYRKPSEENS